MVLIKSGRNGCLQRIEVTLLEEKEWEINIIVPAHTKCQGFTLYGAKMWNQLHAIGVKLLSSKVPLEVFQN